MVKELGASPIFHASCHGLNGFDGLERKWAQIGMTTFGHLGYPNFDLIELYCDRMNLVAEGYWLKQASMSPYAGSMYHGSPLLLSVVGPLTVKRIEGQPDHVLCRTSSLAAFGWVMATHLSLYPAILIIPVMPCFYLAVYLHIEIFAAKYAPPRKLFLLKGYCKIGDNNCGNIHCEQEEMINRSKAQIIFSRRPVVLFFFWTTLWSVYVLVLCGISVKQYSGLWEMFQRTYGFILTVEDMSPNIGVLWYFFAEVFDFFRNFFLIVFHVNILFMILPLAIRLNHRPCFLAFVYIAISSMLKSYPSVGDSALYLGLLVLFLDELADMPFSFFIFCGYVGISLLSPVMHNLWIWRGTGNANFYFATAIAYACLQIILLVESVSAMLNHDRKIRKLSVANLQDGKS
ncbi:hypothetical protein GH714_002488 [Hevea brasiliensis]|uniref:GPI transamidase subunit PIG-U n=1 Tax=Hevea brasiliensis TaxID=3981 RepID=A0A6A6L9S4_HEVBR|nr:hypothetical protein GH714_002488 [Hevea brasiliensis]